MCNIKLYNPNLGKSWKKKRKETEKGGVKSTVRGFREKLQTQTQNSLFSLSFALSVSFVLYLSLSLLNETELGTVECMCVRACKSHMFAFGKSSGQDRKR